ncbi:ATP-binding protein [Acholeplasma vituli]|uniref:histidine kinase n=1 Tax=Paracholeplasma vituli TaxID=69473 RepID=A0ABT2PWP2_9MOLU|nr:ATP-binding protein [Paracholeplasma vituli]MCU0104749.1 ATP-binding protein [Paracholeplasma vituli]
MKKTFVLYHLIVTSLVVVLYLGISLTLTNYVNRRQSAYMLDVVLEDTVIAYNLKTVSDTEFVTLYKNSNKRISIISPSGITIADSMKLSTSGNQSIYPEIKQLGKAFTRYSDTLNLNLMYIADEAVNGNYVRVAIVMDEQIALNTQTILILILISLGILGLSVSSYQKISDTFMRPIHDIVVSVKSIKEGNYQWVMPATQYDEINELLREINGVNESIVNTIQNLNEKEELLSILVRNMDQGILLIGSDQSIVFYNDLAKRWFNIKEKDLLLSVRNKDVYEAIKLATEESISMTFTVPYHDRFISVTVTSVHNKLLLKPTGKQGVLVTLVDDTDRIRLENNKRDFFANASHELRTPLTAIKGSAELMYYDMATIEEKKKLSEEIIRQVVIMDNLIKDMLELSRLENRPKTEQISFNLKKVLDGVLEDLNPLIIDKSIQVSLSTQNVLFKGIETDFKSLFKNLIENAIKYNKVNGTIEIILTQTEEAIEFVIKDSGIGIPKAHQERIFERFYQVNKAKSLYQNGTGLGLAIVKHVVSLYKGSITVESELNEGTTFKVVFHKE